MRLRRGSFLAAVLALVACTKVERNVLAPSAPTLAEIEGDYSAVWVGQGKLLAVAKVSGDAVTFTPYPCRPEGSSDSIGGALVSYDENTGDALVDLKSLDGFARVRVTGRFTRDGMRGSYAVDLLGVACDRGELTLARDR